MVEFYEKNIDFKVLLYPLKEYIVPILDEAVSLCRERHLLGLEQGVDNYTFGTDAFGIVKNKVKAKIEDGQIPFHLTNKQGFVVAYKHYEFRFYKVGDSYDNDIHTSFPNNGRGACNDFNSCQIPFDFGADFPEPQTLIVAYMANPIDGLCAVYLTEVGRTEKGHIVAWGKTEELYRLDTEETSADSEKSLVPAEESPIPSIKRNKPGKWENG